MKKDLMLIFLITLIFLCVLPFFYLHQGLLLIDTGREFFIPQEMLNGNVLYKDIFNIYGALSYQINALLFMIFGQKISVLNLIGIFNSYVILITLYFISREFLSKSKSFVFTVFIMFALCFQTFLYNSNLTYSFAIIYALSSFLLSVLFLIKYTKNKNPVYACISSFCAGISLSAKYEFVLYLFVLLYGIKDLRIKNRIKVIGCFFIVPFISYGSLFIHGMNLNDVKTNAVLIYQLITAPLLKEFFIKTNLSVLNSGIYAIFSIIPILNIFLLVFYRKKIFENKALLIFILSAITASAKSILSLNINHMGLFLLPVCLLALIIMLNYNFQRFLTLFLTAGIVMFAIEDFSSLKYKDYLLNTKKGDIYTYKKDGKLIKQVSDFILKNSKPDDKVVVLPEGSIINFLTDRKGESKYYNLSPLFYFDVFGEEKILKDFKSNPPEYFVVLPIDNIEYGYSIFGKDYAQNLYSFIKENYKLIQDENGIEIYYTSN